jgi:hypothetical protein
MGQLHFDLYTAPYRGAQHDRALLAVAHGGAHRQRVAVQVACASKGLEPVSHLILCSTVDETGRFRAMIWVDSTTGLNVYSPPPARAPRWRRGTPRRCRRGRSRARGSWSWASCPWCRTASASAARGGCRWSTACQGRTIIQLISLSLTVSSSATTD